MRRDERKIKILQVGWLRASDQTILSVHTRTVTHNARISVSYESNGCSMPAGVAGGSAFGVTGSSQAADEVVNGTWRLHIRQLKESDRDCYMCQINTSPMISELGCLDILGESRMPSFLFYSGSIDPSIGTIEFSFRRFVKKSFLDRFLSLQYKFFLFWFLRVVRCIYCIFFM